MVDFCAPGFSTWEIKGSFFFNPCVADVITIVASLLLIAMVIWDLVRIGSAKPSSDVHGSPVVDGKITLTSFAVLGAIGTVVERLVADDFGKDLLFIFSSCLLILGLGLLILYFARVRRLELNDGLRLKITVILFTIALGVRLFQVPQSWYFVVWLLVVAILVVLMFFMFAPVSRVHVNYRIQAGSASNGHRAAVITTAVRLISYGLIYLRFREIVTWPWAAVLSASWIVDILAIIIPIRGCNRNHLVRAAWEPVAAGPLLYSLLAGFPGGTIFRIIVALAAMDVLDKKDLDVSLVMLPFALSAVVFLAGLFAKSCLSRTNRILSPVYALLVAATVAAIWLRMDGTWQLLNDAPWVAVLIPAWIIIVVVIITLAMRMKRLRSDDFLADLNPQPLVEPGASELAEALRSRLPLKDTWTLPARNEARYQWLAPLGDLFSVLGHAGTLALVLFDIRNRVNDATPAERAAAIDTWGANWYEMEFLSGIDWVAVVPVLAGEILRLLVGAAILFFTEFYPRCRLRYLLLRYTCLKDKERRDNVDQQRKDIDNAKRLRRMGKNLGPLTFGTAKVDVISEWMRLHLGLPEAAMKHLGEQFDPGMSLIRITKESKSDREFFARLSKFVGIKALSHFYKLKASLKYMTEDIDPKLYHRLVEITPEVIADQWLPLLGFDSVRLRKAIKRERLDGRVLYSVHSEDHWVQLMHELDGITDFGALKTQEGKQDGEGKQDEEGSDRDSVDGEFEPTAIFRGAFPAAMSGEELTEPSDTAGSHAATETKPTTPPAAEEDASPSDDGRVPCDAVAISRKAVMGCINQLRDKHVSWNMHQVLSRLRKSLHFAHEKGFDHSLDPAKFDKPLQSWSCKDAMEWLLDLSVPRQKVDTAGSRGLSGLLLSTPWFRARHLATLLEVPRFVPKFESFTEAAAGTGSHRILDSSMPAELTSGPPSSTRSTSNRFFNPEDPSELSDEDRDIPPNHMLNTQYESIRFRFKELRKDAMTVQEIWGLRLAKEKQKEGKRGKMGKKKKEQLKELELEVLEGRALQFAPGAGVGLAGQSEEKEEKSDQVAIEVDHDVSDDDSTTSNHGRSNGSEDDTDDPDMEMATAMSRSLQESQVHVRVDPAKAEQKASETGNAAERKEQQQEEADTSSESDEDGDENPTLVATASAGVLAPAAVSPAAPRQAHPSQDTHTSDSDDDETTDDSDSEEENPIAPEVGLVGASVTPRVSAATGAPAAAGAEDSDDSSSSDSSDEDHGGEEGGIGAPPQAPIDDIYSSEEGTTSEGTAPSGDGADGPSTQEDVAAAVEENEPSDEASQTSEAEETEEGEEEEGEEEEEEGKEQQQPPTADPEGPRTPSSSNANSNTEAEVEPKGEGNANANANSVSNDAAPSSSSSDGTEDDKEGENEGKEEDPSADTVVSLPEHEEHAAAAAAASGGSNSDETTDDDSDDSDSEDDENPV